MFNREIITAIAREKITKYLIELKLIRDVLKLNTSMLSLLQQITRQNSMSPNINNAQKSKIIEIQIGCSEFIMRSFG